jgi:5-formyltetrahydrofolate cyclo-ligase
MPKRPIREKLLAERRHCSVETCLYLSLRVQERFLECERYRQASGVGLYCAFMNEVQTELVARQALADGKLLAYPRVTGTNLEFVQVSGLGDMAPGAFGILEPIGERGVPLAQLDLLVVPGVAFDLLGNRLGYGKGYYDRALANCCPTRPERVGFAYEFQLVDRLPASGHDVRLTQLVTEQRLIRFPSGGQTDH